MQFKMDENLHPDLAEFFRRTATTRPQCGTESFAGEAIATSLKNAGPKAVCSSRSTWALPISESTLPSNTPAS